MKRASLKIPGADILICFISLCCLPALLSAQSHEHMESNQHVVEYAALDFMFAGPPEIPSGWITFRMPNRGEEPHVMLLIRLPEGVSYAEYYEATLKRTENSETPEWWDDRVIMGGPAVLSPGFTGETTMKLDPGEYAMICPVGSAVGKPHSAMGMMRPLTVTEEESGAPVPEADITLTLRSLEFELDGAITPGRRTIGVVFEHQPEGKPHDVHVARMGPEQTLEDFAASMRGEIEFGDFYFIGGAEDMPEGSTAYFTADFEPGRYAFWCHYHSEDGMVQEFTVEPLETAQQSGDAEVHHSSPEVELIRSKFDDYHSGNWTQWLSKYHDNARIFYNSPVRFITPLQAAQGHEASVKGLSHYLFDPASIRIYSFLNESGETWVSFYGNWEATLPDNIRFVVPTHATYLFIDGKIAEEHGYWDNTIFRAALVKSEAAKSQQGE